MVAQRLSSLNRGISFRSSRSKGIAACIVIHNFFLILFSVCVCVWRWKKWHRMAHNGRSLTFLFSIHGKLQHIIHLSLFFLFILAHTYTVHRQHHPNRRKAKQFWEPSIVIKSSWIIEYQINMPNSKFKCQRFRCFIFILCMLFAISFWLTTATIDDDNLTKLQRRRKNIPECDLYGRW